MLKIISYPLSKLLSTLLINMSTQQIPLCCYQFRGTSCQTPCQDPTADKQGQTFCNKHKGRTLAPDSSSSQQPKDTVYYQIIEECGDITWYEVRRFVNHLDQPIT